VKYKDTVRIAMVSEITNGAYYSVTTTQSQYIGNMTHDPLFKFDYSVNEAVPVLAKEAIDVNGDGKTWKVTLNEGVGFHYREKDYNTELKASDVVFTYEFCKTGGKGTEAGVVARTINAMTYVESIEATGDYEVTFKLTSPIFDWTNYLTSPILSEKGMEEYGYTDGQEVATGRYYINYAESMSGQQWVMTRYDGYWGGIEMYPTKNIVFVIKEDINTGSAALQAGEVDFLSNPGATITLSYEGNPDYKIESIPAVTQSFIGFNAYDGTGFFDNEDSEEKTKLRQAIRLAIDKDALCAVMYAANPSAGDRVDSCFGTATTGYVDLGKTEFNVEKAQALMKELGYNENNRLPLKLAHYASYATYGQIVQDQLKAIYIDVEMCTFDTSIFGSTLRTGQGWDLVINYYGVGNVALGSTMGTMLLNTGSMAKTYGLNSKKLTDAGMNVMNQPTAEKQMAAFADYQKMVDEYVPYIPTHAGKVQHVMIAEMEGLVIAPSVGSQDFCTLRIPE